MAATTIARDHALATRVWAKRLAVEALHATEADKLVGESQQSIIVVKDELQKGSGDRITIGLRAQIEGEGQIGLTTLEGNEEELNFYTDDLYIENQRHAVAIKGIMSQQRVLFDLRAEAKSAMVDWWKKVIDIGLINQLAGNTAQTNLRWTANNTVTAPTAAQRLYANGATAATSLIDTSFKFDLTMLDNAVYLADTLDTPIRKAELGGGLEGYVALLHPAQVLDLRKNVSEGQWSDIQRAAMQGGDISKNPIFTGAIGYYNGVVMRMDARVPWGDSTQRGRIHHTDLGAATAGTTNVARGIFLGAQSGAIAFGRAGGMDKFRWVEVLKDYEDFYGVAASLVWGAKKMIFQSTDFSTITLESFSPGA